jgi:polyisoprenoid-binding protein YceI
MRKIALGLLLTSAGAVAELKQWRIDPAHSAAHFSVRHMMVSNVRGHFGKISGSAAWDPSDLSKASVEVTIDVNSIDTREPKRDAHLKSPDFFDAANHPTMTFKSRRVERAGEGRLRLIGDLTIRGVTREVVFDVEGPSPEIPGPRGARIGATATTRINRKDFGMTWNRTLDAGGLVVGDEVQITVDVELIEVRPSAG